MNAPASRPPRTRLVLPSAAGVIPEIESLRGIAITLVFVFHADASVLSGTSAGEGLLVSPWRAFSLGGHTGVSLFFILSGFLLSRPFWREAAGGRQVSRPAYYARRALRILPLYYVAVAVAAIHCARHLGDVLRGVPYLFFLNSLPGIASPLPPYSNVWWSLATEAQFYLLLPLLPFLLRSQRRCWLGGALLAAYGLAYAAVATRGLSLAHTPEGQVALTLSLFGRGPLFAFGMTAGWFWDRYGARVQAAAAQTGWMRNGGADLLLLLAVFGLGLLLRRVVFVGYWVAEGRWPYWHVVEGGLWTAVLLLLLLAPLRSKRLLSNPVWSTIGLLSYSIYMIHTALIDFSLLGFGRLTRTGLNGWTPAAFAAMAAVALVCVGLSAVTYALIERPFLTRKARLAA